MPGLRSATADPGLGGRRPRHHPLGLDSGRPLRRWSAYDVYRRRTRFQPRWLDAGQRARQLPRNRAYYLVRYGTRHRQAPAAFAGLRRGFCPGLRPGGSPARLGDSTAPSFSSTSTAPASFVERRWETQPSGGRLSWRGPPPARRPREMGQLPCSIWNGPARPGASRCREAAISWWLTAAPTGHRRRFQGSVIALSLPDLSVIHRSSRDMIRRPCPLR